MFVRSIVHFSVKIWDMKTQLWGVSSVMRCGGDWECDDCKDYCDNLPFMKIQLIFSCWAYEQLQHTSDKVGKGLDTCKAKRALTGQESLPKHLNNLEQKYETIGNWKIEFFLKIWQSNIRNIEIWALTYSGRPVALCHKLWAYLISYLRHSGRVAVRANFLS